MKRQRVLRILILAAATLAFLPGSALASHFRGISTTYTVDDSGLLTVEAFSVWRTGAVNTPFFQLRTAAGGGGTILGNLAVSSAVDIDTGTELGGSSFTVRRSVHTFNMAALSPGTYFARFQSAARVAGINNAPQGTFSAEVTVIFNGTGPGTGHSGPTMIPATIDIVSRGFPYEQNLNATDPDGSPVNYQFLVGATAPDFGPTFQIPGLTIDAIGTVSLTGASTAALALGRWVYKVRATDGSGATSERDVLLVVEDNTPANQAPVLSPIGPKVVAVNTPLSFVVSGSDPDAGNVVTVRAANLPAGATFPETSAADNVSSTFNWTPVNGQEGTHTVFFDVFDDAPVPLIDAETVEITVTGANSPPVLDPIGDRSVGNGGTLTFNITGSDPDAGDSLTFQGFFLPAGATLTQTGPTSAQFNWTPSAGQFNSTFTGVTFRVTDDGVPNLFDDEPITLTVGAGNAPPAIDPLTDLTVSVGQLVQFVVTATDPNASQTITLEPGTGGLPVGATFPSVSGTSPQTSTFTWTPTAAQVGPNVVNFKATDNGSPVLSSTRSVTITVGPTGTDLSVTKSDSADPVTAGNSLTYTVTVTNNGPSDAQDVVVTDTLPTGVTFVSTNGCGEDPNGVAACTLGTIPASSSKQYTITVMVSSGISGTITNNVSVSSSTPETNPGNESASEDTVVNTSANLSISKSDSADPVTAGNNLTYTVTVTNNGPSDAQNVVVTDNLPAGVTLVSTSGCAEDPNGVATCSLGTIDEGTSKQYTITVTVDSDTLGVITNNATVSSETPDSNAGDNSTSQDTTVLAEADLSIAKTDAPDPVVAGTDLTYTVTVTNAGPSAAQNVVVSDTLPAGVTFVSTAGCAEDPNGVPTCSLGTIGAGASKQYTITVTVDAATLGVITNQVSVSSDATDPSPANNDASEDTTVLSEADLSVTKVDSQDPVPAGAPLSYTVTVSNAGPSDALNVVASDTLPAGVTFVSTSGCTNDPAGVPACNLGTIAAGASKQYTIDVTVDSSTTGTITNGVSVSSDTAEPDPSDNTASEDTLADDLLPTVVRINSVSDTGDGELAECENTKVSLIRLLVTFSEEVRDPAGDVDPGDVTNPANYLLVASGPDHDFATSVCGPALGDDKAIAIDAVTYDNPTRTATLSLNGGSALDDSLYRLLVCGSTAIRDVAGNALDGDGDGTQGGDFVRTYRVDRANLFTNAFFDCTLENWITVSTLPEEIEYSTEDVDDSLVSGSARVTNLSTSTDFSLAQCVPMSAPEYGLGNWLRVDAAAGVQLSVSRTCELFSLAGCTGSSFGVDVSVAFVEDTAGSWQFLSSLGNAPLGTASALCSYDLRTAGGESFDAFLDATFLTGGTDLTIFSDGFESGDVSVWSNAVGVN